MAFSDYHACDKCGDGYPDFPGYRVYALCNECEQTHEIVIHPKRGSRMNIPNTIASDTLVEAVARAMWIDMAQGIDDPAQVWDAPEEAEHPLYWRQRMDDNRPRYLDAAQAALTAIADAGYAVVPREPTRDMISAGIIERHDQPTPEAWSLATENIYRAMINAVTHCNHTNNGKAE